jgi:L-threonylcarbamoyladenylate synthase
LASHRILSDDVASAAEWIRNGGIVAFPTETFYGLAVDPSQPDAVDALFALKGRPASSALPLIGASIEHVERFCGRLEGHTARLAATFWPGPLSLVLGAPDWLAPGVDGGTGTIAVRVPDHPVARELAARTGRLITATSSNPSGERPPTTAGAVRAFFTGTDVRVVDGGTTPGGAPSTIVDARGTPIRLVRAGAIAWERVLRSMHE